MTHHTLSAPLTCAALVLARGHSALQSRARRRLRDACRQSVLTSLHRLLPTRLKRLRGTRQVRPDGRSRSKPKVHTSQEQVTYHTHAGGFTDRRSCAPQCAGKHTRASLAKRRAGAAESMRVAAQGEEPRSQESHTVPQADDDTDAVHEDDHAVKYLFSLPREELIQRLLFEQVILSAMSMPS